MAKLLCLAALSLATVIAIPRWSWAIDRHVTAGGLDLYVFRHTAECLLLGAGDPYAQLEFHPVNLLAPHAHVIFWPLTGLAHPVAFAIWLALSAVALLLSLVIIADTLGVRLSACSWVLVSVLALSSSFGMSHVRTGQIYAVMTLPLVLAWRWDRANQKPSVVGAIVGALASMKLLLLLLVAWFVWRRSWRAASAATLTIVLLVSAGIAAFGLPTYEAWVVALGKTAKSGGGIDASIMQTMLRWFQVTSLFSPIAIAPTLAAWVTAVLVVAVIGVTAWRSVPGDAGWLAILTAALLLSPKGWLHAAPWLLGPLMGLYVGGLRWPTLVIAGLLYLPEYAPFLGQPSPWLTPLIGSLAFWTISSAWLIGVTRPAEITAEFASHPGR